MPPLLGAATGGRMTPSRLWHLAQSRGYFLGYGRYAAIEGVNYGLVKNYWDVKPDLFEELKAKDLEALEDMATPEEIAEHLRVVGYWVWMRPDRWELRLAHRNCN
ncbi:hypothetical protein FRC06_006854 [Ceratobasidium sp. 370]|nr:hypothetical protein FRC06_006854 [Ceratobasidium sp. 370]